MIDYIYDFELEYLKLTDQNLPSKDTCNIHNITVDSM